MENTMGQAGCPFRLGATGVKHRFDIVQIEHGAPAGWADRLQVRRAPEMLDDAEVVVASANGYGHLPLEARKAVHERRNFAGHPGGVAQRAGGQAAAVGGQIEDRQPADKTGGQHGPRIGRARLAKHNHIDGVAGRQVIEQRSRA